jgi:hypothetical protein
MGVLRKLINAHFSGVRIVSSKLVALDDVQWTSSEDERVSSSEDEVHELY